jgi:quinoprotein glucose dehydrogenase
VQPWTADDEEGLLGLAFHPRFKENGELFVYYSSRAEPRTSIVSRFRVAESGGQHADANEEEVLMKIPQPFSNHNGGSLVFGNDGFLYIALGDGGGRNDPMHHAQNLKTWMGSILRIDVDQKQQGLGYAIPQDNPFVDRPQAKPEIFAYGFRNVWRLSVDRKTGLIWCGDVGQDLWEEINILRSGGNYGWSVREGNYGFGNQPGVRPEQTVAPCWEYDHQIGKSITGGVVYRGDKLPELAGHYLFGDYISGRIWALHYDTKSEKPIRNMVVLKQGTPAIAFGEDESGEVYYLVETVSGNGIQKFSRSK